VPHTLGASKRARCPRTRAGRVGGTPARSGRERQTLGRTISFRHSRQRSGTAPAYWKPSAEVPLPDAWWSGRDCFRLVGRCGTMPLPNLG
jgi:hypothetical protein